MIPAGITDESIREAVAKIDSEGVPPPRRSRHYDLYIPGKPDPYPPKYVLALAAEHVSGVMPPARSFNAVQAKNYLLARDKDVRDRRLKYGQTQQATDIEDAPPSRVKTTTYRILRDTELARQVKSLYGYRCQIADCTYLMQLPLGSYYAEAHHIRPLGKHHQGLDIKGNILCLCPNHHAELDYGVKSLKLEHLTLDESHKVSPESIEYHNSFIYGRGS